MDTKVWVSHPTRVWTPAVRSLGAGPGTFTLDDGEIVNVPEKEVANLADVYPDQEDGVDDICDLKVVTEASLLHTVRCRYAKNEIYTRVARTLVALNPFRNLPIYSAQFVERHLAAPSSLEAPPHIFGVAQDALSGLRAWKKDQAVLIGGESGAGKTESAKLILSFVADAVRGASDDGVEDRLMQTNPVLEAFGNAMTVRNNNSSRFGKWVDLRVSENMEILGCHLTSYLLETMRVCGQSRDERGFHVFFQLLQARKHPDLASLDLQEPKYYRYLQEGQTTAPGVDDKRCFEELREAFAALGMDAAKQLEVFKVVGAVLLLGNLDFEAEGEGSRLINAEAAVEAAALLGVPFEKLSHCIRFRKLVVGRDTTHAPMRPEQASAVRDGFARLLYGRLFKWLLSQMNTTLTVVPQDESVRPDADRAAAVRERLLGILDIAGFECFKQNSLEQLMINLSNEHLQQHYNNTIFQAELEECAREGVDAHQSLRDAVASVDNSESLTLIDGKGGVLDLLDEAMIVPKATDETFMSKVLKVTHKRLILPKIKGLTFGIKHFAGDVTYDSDGWLVKNGDRPPDTAIELLSLETAVSPLQEIAQAMTKEAAEEAKAAAGRKAKAKSVTAGFRTSLRSLVAKIAAAEPHYVRCIKPNMEKVAGKFDAKVVIEQLLLSGVFATVKIRQSGYALRLPFLDFYGSYRCVMDPKLGGFKPPSPLALRVQDDSRKAASTLVEALMSIKPPLFESRAFVLGHTKVFIKLTAARVLDSFRQKALSQTAARLQALARGFKLRKWMRERKELSNQLRAQLAKLSRPDLPPKAPVSEGRRPSVWTNDSIVVQLGSPEACKELAEEMGKTLQALQLLSFRNTVVLDAERTQARIEIELETLAEAEGLMSSMDIITLEKILARARGLQLADAEAMKALEARRKTLKAQQPLLNAMKTAYEEVANTGQPVPQEELEHFVSVAEELGLKENPGKWMDGLNGSDLLAKVVNDLEEIKRKAAQQAAEASEKLRHRLSSSGFCVEGASPGAAAAASPASSPKHGGGADKDEAPHKRSSRRTVSGLKEAEHTKIWSSLARAQDEYDAEALERLLRQAAELGLGLGDEDPRLEIASTMFERLQDATQVQLLLAQAKAEVASAEDVPLGVLKRLENLSRLVKARPDCGVAETSVQEESLVQSRLLRRASVTSHTSGCRRSVFDEQDPEWLELAKRTFERLGDFSRLKHQKTWGGRPVSSVAPGSARRASVASVSGRRRSSVTFATDMAAADADMLVFSKACIPESLTTPPPGGEEAEFETAAVLNFRNILVVMGDRPAQETQRRACSDAVVQMLQQSGESLRDEAFLQVLKQLTGNPSSRSRRLGWELLQRLCSQLRPSGEMTEFMRAWLQNEATTVATGDDSSMPRACAIALDTPVAASSPPEELGSSDSGELKAENERLKKELEAAKAAAGPDSVAAVQSAAMNTTARVEQAMENLLAEVSRLRLENERQAGEISGLRAGGGGLRAAAAEPPPASSGGEVAVLQEALAKLTQEVATLAADKTRQAVEIDRLSTASEQQAQEIETLQTMRNALTRKWLAEKKRGDQVNGLAYTNGTDAA
eukprot:TRINITY_DN121480_c0_g1_i1.p1 TRINITY_DN121480_c0_g1~~TRINITY_DN121480_c0_g1_i1.p1  ORF type:complete len:1589 (+),score=477.23 TRINITY_DN121480_c0_g1_i1:91-4857(+)